MRHAAQTFEYDSSDLSNVWPGFAGSGVWILVFFRTEEIDESMLGAWQFHISFR